MAERDRKEAAGESYKRPVKPAWAIVTVQNILDNDFYIGTLRQGKYTRKKINGKDVLQDEEEQIVIENHHQAITDYRTFATTRALREKRTTSHYRGVKKYYNIYSGFLVCGDCGSPMFAMSRSDLKSAYTCGTYHRRGREGCTSHHIRVDKLERRGSGANHPSDQGLRGPSGDPAASGCGRHPPLRNAAGGGRSSGRHGPSWGHRKF